MSNPHGRAARDVPASQRVLVTGGAGFIGTVLCGHLAAAGHRVVAVDRLDGPRQLANAARLDRHDRVEVLGADLLEVDVHSLLDGIDVVVHLAGTPGVQTSWGAGFSDHLGGNVGVTQRLLDAALASGVRRLVVASSSSVYGDAGEVVAPISPYGVTKAAVELLVGAYASRGVPAVALRYFTVYGRGQRPDMAIDRMFRAALGGPAFPMRGDGTQARDVTHVDDVARATAAALHADLAPGTVLDVGSGRPRTLTELLAAVGALVGRAVPLEVAPVAAGDPRRTLARTGPTRRLLGWSPTVPLADGLADQLAHLDLVPVEDRVARIGSGR